MILRGCAVLALMVACTKKEPTNEKAPSPSADVTADEKARAAAVAGELKKSLLGALQGAMQQGAPAAIDACHAMAPGLAASLSRDGIAVGRTTRKTRNPSNAPTGWRTDALAAIERAHAEGKLAGAMFAARLPDGRVAYAEPLVVQELCLNCHGANVAPEVTTVLAAKYPNDQATGYAVGDLRGIVWVELPAR